MKTNLLVLAAAAVGIAFSLTGCVPFDPAFDGGYVGTETVRTYSSGPSYYSSPSYYSDTDFYYYDGGAYPSYYNRSYGTYTTGYSYYRGRSVCPICHHSPCSGHNGHYNSWRSSGSYSRSNYDHDDHNHHSSSGSSHSSGPILYQRARGAPGESQGVHSKDWFLSRGYSPRQLEKSDDHGHSTKKNDHDSDDKKKHHR